MAIVRMSSADVLAANSSEEIVGLIKETQKAFPEIETFQATPVEKTSYKTLVETALPSVAFRAINAGREHQASTLTARDVACKFLDASWSIDEAAAKACEWGVDAACAIQAQAHVRAALKAICSQIWYGVSADANGFAGFASILDQLSDAMVLGAGGTTAGTGSSVFAVRFGIDACCLAWGMNGQISEGERIYTQIFDADGKIMWGWAQAISGYVGLQLTDYKASGRICNLTEDTGKGLTDDLIAKLLEKFPVGGWPDAMYMSKRSLRQLQDSRTATNATGAPAPFPSEAFGVPIYVTEAILSTETLLT